MASKLSKLRNALVKEQFNTTLSTPDNWASWGNHALNWICTGSFTRGIPNRRVVMTYGMSGTGKSLILGHAAKSIQDMGYQIIYIDTEEALDPQYLSRIGLDIDDEEKFLPVRLSTIEELATVTSHIFNNFDKNEKFAVFVDSLGMLETEDHAVAFEKSGDMKNDMGLFAKKLKKYLKNICSRVGEYDCFFLCNQHAYANQNVLDGRGTHVASGGEAQIFIPSITLFLKKLDLKEDGSITGIRLKAITKKTRFTQLGLDCEIEVPYKVGIDPMAGVLDIIENHGENIGLTKSGAWFSYTDKDGEVHKFQKSKADEYLPELMALMEPKGEIVEMGEDEEGIDDRNEDD